MPTAPPRTARSSLPGPLLALALLAGCGEADPPGIEPLVRDSAGVVIQEFPERIGGAGEGPGEFRLPVGLVALAGDTILVWDRGSRRLSGFSPEGRLERERTLREPGGIRTLRRG